MQEVRINDSSFRDPNGFVVESNGEIYRILNTEYNSTYDMFMQSGLYKELINEKLIEFQKYKENYKTNLKFEEIKNNIEKLDIKVVKSESGDIISFKPEFEQMKKLALDYSMNFRELNQDIRNQVKKLFSS